MTGKPVVNDDSRGPGLPATRRAKMVRCSGARIRMLGPLSEEQIAKLQEYLSESGCDAAQVARFCRTFGVETLDQLPAAKFEQAIERIDAYRVHRVGRPSREERDRELQQNYPVLWRAEQRITAGMDVDEAWDLALVEELNKERPWSLRLLKQVAWRFLAEHEPKLIAEWEAPRARDRRMIDQLAKWLKAKGERGYRGKAEQMCADIQRVSVHTLRKRQQRARKV